MPASEAGTPLDPRLGKSNREISLATSLEQRALCAAMATECRRRLDIISRRLDPPVYDTAEFAEAVKQLAIRHSKARIRILVMDPEPIIRQGHRLLDLAGKLPSFIELRVPSPENQNHNEAFMIADGVGYIHRPRADRYDGKANFHHPAVARELTRRFDELWQSAQLDPNLRKMVL
jgi:hypothetical protein